MRLKISCVDHKRFHDVGKSAFANSCNEHIPSIAGTNNLIWLSTSCILMHNTICAEDIISEASVFYQFNILI